ncbi:hypothetical protein GOQ30_11265 [Flavobacterium sp. TP390]|uniref:Uncharacterized protein n=1 Tax=Flavobacterium profundi TaxID=1774945 RepID=A0A6I4ISS9_9FLAO|nr:hypothetical protein [Flavobacterium profundi]MVO09737.1 hypothetical protein [Flavobacterium profundi]
MDFVEITSNNRFFELHPEKIAGVEYESSSIFFPKMIKGTKEDVLRVTGMINDKSKRIAIAKAKAKAIKMRIKLL